MEASKEIVEYLGGEKAVNKLQPLVSVCVITYQHARFIEKCLDSILSQETDFPFEVIVGEDESTDGTREICMTYAERHPDKIRLFLRSRKDVIYVDGRPTGRYNFMQNIRASRGRYITVCEGDDHWTDPKKLAKQVECLEGKPESILCFHDFVAIDADNNLSPRRMMKSESKKDRTPFELARGCAMHMNTVMFRKLTDRYPDEFLEVVNSDTFLLAYLGQFGGASYLHDVKPSYYRVHNGGIWSSNDKKVEGPLKTFLLLKRVMPKKFYPVINYRIFRASYKMWMDFGKKRQYRKAMSMFFKTVVFIFRFMIIKRPANY